MTLDNPSVPRLTPWVTRLIAITAVAQLLLETIFTSPGIVLTLSMDPAGFLGHPWGALTYLLVHGGLLHLGANMFWLYLFGTAVETRMGSRTFLWYYLYCGVGAALFALLINTFLPVGRMIGASGAVFGVTLAFAMFWPDQELVLFPIMIPIKARTLMIGAAVVELVLSQVPVFARDGVAHEAHLGGMLAGWLFFRVQRVWVGRTTPLPRRQVEQAVVLQQTAQGHEADPRPTSLSRSFTGRPGHDPVAAEVDRVLDKISSTGIDSLTPEERRFLDEVSKRKQRDLN